MSLETHFKDIAEQFLQSISQVSGCPMIVCDDRGIIAAASVRSRIGQPHAGAQKICRGEVEEYQVSAEEAAENPLIKEGYNSPMVIEGKRIGTFGIAGPLAVTKPLARVAALVLANLVREKRQQEAVREAADRAFETVERLARQVDELAGGALGVADTITAASTEVSMRVEKAEAVVGTIQRIAQQSRILSINGSVEATRAGDQGRAFAVVAKDMTRLSDETKTTSGLIQSALGEIDRSFERLQQAVEQSVAQSKSLQEVRSSFTSLREAVSTMEYSFGSRAGKVPGHENGTRAVVVRRAARLG
jgi:sugar diacid utilization regulator